SRPAGSGCLYGSGRRPPAFRGRGRRPHPGGVGGDGGEPVLRGRGDPPPDGDGRPRRAWRAVGDDGVGGGARYPRRRPGRGRPAALTPPGGSRSGAGGGVRGRGGVRTSGGRGDG